MDRHVFVLLLVAAVAQGYSAQYPAGGGGQQWQSAGGSAPGQSWQSSSSSQGGGSWSSGGGAQNWNSGSGQTYGSSSSSQGWTPGAPQVSQPAPGGWSSTGGSAQGGGGWSSPGGSPAGIKPPPPDDRKYTKKSDGVVYIMRTRLAKVDTTIIQANPQNYDFEFSLVRLIGPTTKPFPSQGLYDHHLADLEQGTVSILTSELPPKKPLAPGIIDIQTTYNIVPGRGAESFEIELVFGGGQKLTWVADLVQGTLTSNDGQVLQLPGLKSGNVLSIHLTLGKGRLSDGTTPDLAQVDFQIGKPDGSAGIAPKDQPGHSFFLVNIATGRTITTDPANILDSVEKPVAIDLTIERLSKDRGATNVIATEVAVAEGRDTRGTPYNRRLVVDAKGGLSIAKITGGYYRPNRGTYKKTGSDVLTTRVVVDRANPKKIQVNSPKSTFDVQLYEALITGSGEDQRPTVAAQEHFLVDVDTGEVLTFNSPQNESPPTPGLLDVEVYYDLPPQGSNAPLIANVELSLGSWDRLKGPSTRQTLTIDMDSGRVRPSNGPEFVLEEVRNRNLFETHLTLGKVSSPEGDQLNDLIAIELWFGRPRESVSEQAPPNLPGRQTYLVNLQTGQIHPSESPASVEKSPTLVTADIFIKRVNKDGNKILVTEIDINKGKDTYATPTNHRVTFDERTRQISNSKRTTFKRFPNPRRPSDVFDEVDFPAPVVTPKLFETRVVVDQPTADPWVLEFEYSVGQPRTGSQTPEPVVKTYVLDVRTGRYTLRPQNRLPQSNPTGRLVEIIYSFRPPSPSDAPRGRPSPTPPDYIIDVDASVGKSSGQPIKRRYTIVPPFEIISGDRVYDSEGILDNMVDVILKVANRRPNPSAPAKPEVGIEILFDKPRPGQQPRGPREVFVIDVESGQANPIESLRYFDNSDSVIEFDLNNGPSQPREGSQPGSKQPQRQIAIISTPRSPIPDLVGKTDRIDIIIDPTDGTVGRKSTRYVIRRPVQPTQTIIEIDPDQGPENEIIIIEFREEDDDVIYVVPGARPNRREPRYWQPGTRDQPGRWVPGKSPNQGIPAVWVYATPDEPGHWEPGTSNQPAWKPRNPGTSLKWVPGSNPNEPGRIVYVPGRPGDVEDFPDDLVFITVQLGPGYPPVLIPRRPGDPRQLPSSQFPQGTVFYYTPPKDGRPGYWQPGKPKPSVDAENPPQDSFIVYIPGNTPDEPGRLVIRIPNPQSNLPPTDLDYPYDTQPLVIQPGSEQTPDGPRYIIGRPGEPDVRRLPPGVVLEFVRPAGGRPYWRQRQPEIDVPQGGIIIYVPGQPGQPGRFIIRDPTRPGSDRDLPSNIAIIYVPGRPGQPGYYIPGRRGDPREVRSFPPGVQLIRVPGVPGEPARLIVSRQPGQQVQEPQEFHNIPQDAVITYQPGRPGEPGHIIVVRPGQQPQEVPSGVTLIYQPGRPGEPGYYIPGQPDDESSQKPDPNTQLFYIPGRTPDEPGRFVTERPVPTPAYDPKQPGLIIIFRPGRPGEPGRIVVKYPGQPGQPSQEQSLPNDYRLVLVPGRQGQPGYYIIGRPGDQGAVERPPDGVTLVYVPGNSPNEPGRFIERPGIDTRDLNPPSYQPPLDGRQPGTILVYIPGTPDQPGHYVVRYPNQEKPDEEAPRDTTLVFVPGTPGSPGYYIVGQPGDQNAVKTPPPGQLILIPGTPGTPGKWIIKEEPRPTPAPEPRPTPPPQQPGRQETTLVYIPGSPGSPPQFYVQVPGQPAKPLDQGVKVIFVPGNPGSPGSYVVVPRGQPGTPVEPPRDPTKILVYVPGTPGQPPTFILRPVDEVRTPPTPIEIRVPGTRPPTQPTPPPYVEIRTPSPPPVTQPPYIEIRTQPPATPTPPPYVEIRTPAPQPPIAPTPPPYVEIRTPSPPTQPPPYIEIRTLQPPTYPEATPSPTPPEHRPTPSPGQPLIPQESLLIFIPGTPERPGRPGRPSRFVIEVPGKPGKGRELPSGVVIIRIPSSRPGQPIRYVPGTPGDPNEVRDVPIGFELIPGTPSYPGEPPYWIPRNPPEEPRPVNPSPQPYPEPYPVTPSPQPYPEPYPYPYPEYPQQPQISPPAPESYPRDTTFVWIPRRSTPTPPGQPLRPTSGVFVVENPRDPQQTTPLSPGVRIIRLPQRYPGEPQKYRPIPKRTRNIDPREPRRLLPYSRLVPSPDEPNTWVLRTPFRPRPQPPVVSIPRDYILIWEPNQPRRRLPRQPGRWVMRSPVNPDHVIEMPPGVTVVPLPRQPGSPRLYTPSTPDDPRAPRSYPPGYTLVPLQRNPDQSPEWTPASPDDTPDERIPSDSTLVWVPRRSRHPNRPQQPGRWVIQLPDQPDIGQELPPGTTLVREPGRPRRYVPGRPGDQGEPRVLRPGFTLIPVSDEPGVWRPSPADEDSDEPDRPSRPREEPTDGQPDLLIDQVLDVGNPPDRDFPEYIQPSPDDQEPQISQPYPILYEMPQQHEPEYPQYPPSYPQDQQPSTFEIIAPPPQQNQPPPPQVQVLPPLPPPPPPPPQVQVLPPQPPPPPPPRQNPDIQVIQVSPQGPSTRDIPPTGQRPQGGNPPNIQVIELPPGQSPPRGGLPPNVQVIELPPGQSPPRGGLPPNVQVIELPAGQSPPRGGNPPNVQVIELPPGQSPPRSNNPNVQVIELPPGGSPPSGQPNVQYIDVPGSGRRGYTQVIQVPGRSGSSPQVIQLPSGGGSGSPQVIQLPSGGGSGSPQVIQLPGGGGSGSPQVIQFPGGGGSGSSQVIQLPGGSGGSYPGGSYQTYQSGGSGGSRTVYPGFQQRTLVG